MKTLLLSVILSLQAFGAAAESLDLNAVDIFPVRVEIAPGKRLARVEVVNRTKHAVAYEVRAETPAGELTGDVLVSPPVLALEPGQRGTVKVGVPTPAPADQEQYARLVLNDVSPAPIEHKADGVFARLSLSLPIFVGAGQAQLSMERTANGYRLANSGTATAKIIRVAGSRTLEYVPPGAATVLGIKPGQKVEFEGLPELVAK